MNKYECHIKSFSNKHINLYFWQTDKNTYTLTVQYPDLMRYPTEHKFKDFNKANEWYNKLIETTTPVLDGEL